MEGCTLPNKQTTSTFQIASNVKYNPDGYTCPVTQGAWTDDVDAGTFTITDNGLRSGLIGSTSITFAFDPQLTPEIEYTLQKGTLTASDFTFTAPSDLVSNGTDKTATVAATAPNVGTITVK